MRTEAQVRQAVAKLPNVTRFAKDHKVPIRTLWRIRAGEPVRRGSIALVNAALDKEKA